MSAVQFTYNGNSITVGDAQCERTWRAGVTGSWGSATIDLPRSSAAASPSYINPDAGSLVRVLSEGGCGAWFGIVTGIEEDGNMVRVSADQAGAILARRMMQRRTTLTNVSPGYVATVALREALVGVGYLNILYTFDGDGPNLTYTLDDGQDCQSVLNDLMNRSDGEVWIDAATGEVRWGGPFSFGTYIATPLIAGGNFYKATRETSVGDRAAEVIAVLDDERFVARAGAIAAGGWPAQVVVNGDNAATLPVLAQSEINQRTAGGNVISGGVASALWTLRECDYVTVSLPWARLGAGLTRTCRVLGRTLRDGDGLMSLDLLVLEPLPGTPLVSGAGGRVRPSQRVGLDTGSGGSFVQAFRQSRRSLAAVDRRVASLERGS